MTGQPGKETNPLHDLLFGEQVQIFSYRETDSEGQQEDAEGEKKVAETSQLVVNEECSDFLQIFLDVKYKNLYSAWAASSQQDVDYTTPTGSKAGSLGRARAFWNKFEYISDISQHITSLWTGNDLKAHSHKTCFGRPLLHSCSLIIICLNHAFSACHLQAAGKTRVWIRRLPKLLFFQLQRVTFDPETKAPRL